MPYFGGIRSAERSRLVKSTASIFLQVVGALLVVVVFGVSLMIWQFNRPPFDLAKLQRLQKGMAQEQVREILGEPRGTNLTGWHYSRAMSWPIVHLHFDANGKLESHDY